MWEDRGGVLLGSAVVRLQKIKPKKKPTVFVTFLFNSFGGERHKLGSGSKPVLIGTSSSAVSLLFPLFLCGLKLWSPASSPHSSFLRTSTNRRRLPLHISAWAVMMGDNDSTDLRVTERHAMRTKSTQQMWQELHVEDIGEAAKQSEMIPNAN